MTLFELSRSPNLKLAERVFSPLFKISRETKEYISRGGTVDPAKISPPSLINRLCLCQGLDATKMQVTSS
ncbi:hypothetical protein L596_028064 [Steinernema carpocapsae]|uniref:Uncharacterized protein n=1 Tax=Steinernema carpocapsae TaxID=34508 RepID=A0A4U5LXF0_STECR|nr:hypothetical protein L596_028064 [Steinernema carpocapsae]